MGGPDRPKPKPKPTPVSTSAPAKGGNAQAGSWFALPQFVTGAQERSLRDGTEARSARMEVERTNQALAERGEYLDTLNDTMNSLTTGASTMLKEAKSLAIKQGVKSKLGSYF